MASTERSVGKPQGFEICVHYYTQFEKQKRLEDLQDGWGSSAVIMADFYFSLYIFL